MPRDNAAPYTQGKGTTMARLRRRDALKLAGKKYPIQYVIVYIATYISALFAAFALYGVCRSAGFPEPTAAFTSVIFMLIFPLI